MRDDEWLEEKMYFLWENYFVDIPRINNVIIKFGKKSKRQLGCIGWLRNRTKRIEKILARTQYNDDERITLINITSYFRDENIPEEIVLGTIAHELCHYAHGFSSPLQQIYSHPHKGGIIRKELQSRGLSNIYKFSKQWLKENWVAYLKQQR